MAVLSSLCYKLFPSNLTENQGQSDTEVTERGEGGTGWPGVHYTYTGRGTDCSCQEARGERTSTTEQYSHHGERTSVSCACVPQYKTLAFASILQTSISL